MTPTYMYIDGNLITDTQVQVTPQGSNYIVMWQSYNHVTLEPQTGARVVRRSQYNQVRSYLDKEEERGRKWAQSVDQEHQEHLEYLRTH